MRHNGFELHVGALDGAAQSALVAEVMEAAEHAPLYEPKTPWGKSMSVRQTNFGPLGWITDAKGYRYGPHHPVTGEVWPPMPDRLLEIWRRYADPAHSPDSCLINLYRDGAKMGMHQDLDEDDLKAPVLGISLGDTAVFRLGGLERKDPSITVKLNSGDISVLTGAARRAYHGVDRILAGSSQLIPGGGRINLTIRRART
jgi:alkylated DNA repair protein (DNA oxidative demethylase)